ncbi:DUF4189 domain-containing protein [Roseococcus sp. YIM B11640]|uniref:DUF4189 domain-containing protein n=1 Tax=Roseococcus sp. YIM B11640 TaxID=3133973 RepID=UPI003C7CCFF9
MRRLILAATLILAAAPALASQPVRARAPQDINACRATCQGQAAQPGASRTGVQACFIRCGVPAFSPIQPVSAAAQQGRGVQAPRQLALQVPPQGYGVIFAARTPSASYGMVVGEVDRLAAHRIAESQCSRGGPGCRIIAEFSRSCAAVAHGVRRSQGAIVMTSDPNTFVVTSISGGSAETRALAEGDALAECRSKDPQATCRIAAVQCGNRNG